MRHSPFSSLAVLLLCATSAAAQPTGPAQIIRGANEARVQSELRKAATPASDGQPASDRGAQVEARGQDADHADHPAAADEPGMPPMPVATEAPDLPLGTLEVTVLDPDGLPFAEAEIVLGIMAAGNRSEQRIKTGPSGKAILSELPVGAQQAYRVNVFHGGAKFSSNPFRMPESGGYRVELPLLPTTQSDRALFAMIGQALVELRDDRLHVTESVRLANAGGEAYVFPGDGLLVELPPGFMVFHWQDQMTDQKATEVPGKGFKLKGSLGPGMVTLAWAYDLKLDGKNFQFHATLPFRTFAYRVIVEAPEGLALKVPGFPDARPFKDEGRNLLVTELQHTPPEPPLEAIEVRIEGIPGPGPGRWIAVGLALVLLMIGLSRAFVASSDGGSRRSLLANRKQELLTLARQLERDRAQSQIGPEYHAQRLDEITTELALVLRDEDALESRTAAQ